jgi:ABC-2 type transport system ATP-binding protein
MCLVHTLQLKDVNSGYNKKPILQHVSFKAEKAGIYVVLGTNGSGKTTLFRTIARVIEPLSGEIFLDYEKVGSAEKSRNRIGYLSHNNAIPEEMTVNAALDFWSKMEGEGIGIDKAISLLDLDKMGAKKFSDLSEGQKKRVSIAATLLKEKDLYLLDEPTSNLDPVFSKKIREIILKMGKDRLVFYSSHNLYEATDIGEHLLLVRNGDVEYFDDISHIKPSRYRIGIKASADISKFVEAEPGEKGYFVLTVSDREEAGSILKRLVENGVTIYEMRVLDNPLQELFEGRD